MHFVMFFLLYFNFVYTVEETSKQKVGLEKAICTYNENLIELHLNDYDKFSH